MRFLGNSISTLANGPSAHKPVILTNEPAPLPGLAALRDHLRLHEKAEDLAKALGSAAGEAFVAAADGRSTTSTAAITAASTATAWLLRITSS